GNSLDITEQKRNEQALKEAKERAEVANYGASQELVEFTELVTGYEFREKSSIEYLKNIYSYFEGIIAALPGYVYWMNRNFIYLGCNNNMAVLHNINSRQDILGKTYEDLYNEESGECYRKADIQVMVTGTSLTTEEMLYYPDGTV